MVLELEDIQKRMDRIEKLNKQEILSIVEILSNLTFFGEMKQAECKFAIDGQCGYFTLNSNIKDKVPIVSKCRINNCKETKSHCHLELSKMSCGMCQEDKPKTGKLTYQKSLKLKSNQNKE